MSTEIPANGIRPFQPPPSPGQPVQVASPASAAGAAASKVATAAPVQRPRVDAAEMQRNVKEAIERLNEQMRKTGRNLNFSMDQQLDRMVITVKNSETGEVIRQIPDEAVVKAAHQIEALKGLLHNEVT